jgi:NAD(P)-dependent dehydrogenase (short-subunit alcohol dehydrogenase family)
MSSVAPASSLSISALVDLSGRRALVTGGAHGIGAAIAARLVEAGARVTVADLDPKGGHSAASMGADFIACDITDAEQLADAVAAAAGAEGLDISINNAGIFPTTGPVGAVTDDFVARMLDVNVRAQFSATRDAAAHMRNGGSIVNMASIAGLRSGANISAYAASKAAVVSMTHAHAIELGPKGIRVNAIAPGIIDTPGVQAQLEPLRSSGVDIDARIAANPVGLAGQPDHVARAVLFLVSDLAAFISGHVLVVDGGSTA